MLFQRIGHAGLVIRTKELSCIMDPVFKPIFCGSVGFLPSFTVDEKLLKKERFDILVISHEHEDHFDLSSINLINRDALVVYPQGCIWIEQMCRFLGFSRKKALLPFERFSFRDIQLTAIPSRVDFREMGMLFKTQNGSLWNMVDTVLDRKIIRKVMGPLKRIDVVIAKFQPVIEELSMNALGYDFPFGQYSDLLADSLAIPARMVIPGSCGIRHISPAWMDTRGWTVNPGQFLADLKRAGSRAEAVEIMPGEALDVPKRKVLKGKSLPWITSGGEPIEYEWRPDHGVDVFKDPNFLGYSNLHLRGIVKKFLNRELLEFWKQSKRTSFWSKNRVLWKLNVIYPDGKTETRILDFGKSPLQWNKKTESLRYHWTFLTTIAASAIAGIKAGEFTTGATTFSGMVRNVSKIYTIRNGQVRVPRFEPRDPILEFLHRGSFQRYYFRQFEKLSNAT